MAPRPRWKPDENEFLRRNMGNMSPEEIAARLGRPVGGVRSRLRIAQQPRASARTGEASGRRRPWTRTEDGKVMNPFASRQLSDDSALGERLNRTVGAIRKRRADLRTAINYFGADAGKVTGKRKSGAARRRRKRTRGEDQ